MTTSQARGIKQDGLNDASVADYLQTFPDFFERNSPLLAKLRLPHLRDVGATVSLVERQVEVLRERNQSLERKLKELVDVARANDALADRIHRLSQRLIRAHTLLETINAVETGRYEPSLSLAFAIAALFALPIENIFQGQRPTARFSGAGPDAKPR